LEGLAFNLHGTDRLVCPMLDARRNQVYTGVYQFAGHELTTLIAPCAVPLTEIAATLNNYEHSVILLGDGASVYAKELESLLKIPYSLAPPHQNRQRAASLAALAQQYIKRGKTTTAAAHAPDYLRVSQAERVKAERERGGTHATIRPMTAADVEVVSEIESRVFSMPWRAADFLEMITAEYAYYYVALINNKPIGAAGARVIAGDAQITNILVDHPYRRCGIARALMQHMLTDLTEKADIFSLEVRTSNIAAINLYQSLGFTPTGHRRDFYENPVEDALVMVKGVSCNIGSKCLRSKGVQC
jgi:ribosomal-protein-alanine acetyltransferase